MSHDVTESTFPTEVLSAKGLVLVDFWAPWCGPCRALSPLLDTIAAENDAVKVVKVNVDENGSIATQFGVRSIPTLILFKDGQAIDTKVGALPKKTVDDWIASNL